MTDNQLPTIAIAGGSGPVGRAIVQAFTSPTFLPHFSRIILLSRQPNFNIPNTTTTIIDSSSLSSLESALSGVSVVVNVIGSSGHHLKDLLLQACANTPSVKLYFPSEYGVDHYLDNGQDGDFTHPDWDAKKAHAALARRLVGEASGRDDGHELRICYVFVALIQEICFTAWLGLDGENRVYEAVGSADQKASWTSWFDIGNTLASLAVLGAHEKLPEYVRVSGDSKSIRECARIMDEARGGGGGEGIKIKEISLHTFKKEVLEAAEPKALNHALRYILGAGKLDFGEKGLGNDNELVNPGGRKWKWKTVEDYAREVGG